MEWTREVFELPDAHGWTARPGNKILVLDRGAVVLEFPGDWFVSPGATQVNIRDRASAEESTSVLAVSSFATPPGPTRVTPRGALPPEDAPAGPPASRWPPPGPAGGARPPHPAGGPANDET